MMTTETEKSPREMKRKVVIKLTGTGIDRIPQDDLESSLLEEAYRIIRRHADEENLNVMTTFVSVLEQS